MAEDISVFTWLTLRLEGEAMRNHSEKVCRRQMTVPLYTRDLHLKLCEEAMVFDYSLLPPKRKTM